MEKILFIINPIAGTKRKNQIISLLETQIDRNKYEFDIAITTRKGHATEMAKMAVAQGASIVVAVGGDGTVNEVARSLVHTDTALGIIPCGSGNGLARHMKISMVPSKAINIINEAHTDVIDYGIVNEAPFFCTCGIGFDASVSMAFAMSGRRGLAAYLEKAVGQWITYKPGIYELVTENSTSKQKALFITFGNASQWGNDGYITPHASLKDGLIDVTIVEPFPAIEIAPMAIQLLNRSIDRNSRIKTFKCDNILIRRTDDGAVHFDGDPTIMSKEINVKIVPKGLKVIIPKKSADIL